jgi:hypothetical protein
LSDLANTGEQLSDIQKQPSLADLEANADKDARFSSTGCFDVVTKDGCLVSDVCLILHWILL